MRILDVAEATAYIKELFDSDPILQDVWIRGEISNFSRSSAGHIYFSLKSESSQIRCVLFRGNARWLTFQPQSGDAVLAHGNVSVYEARGEFQLYVDLLQPEGTGLLQLQFEQLRRKLELEGLFAPERKRPLPAFPRTIGVVTSPTGAVWHDIQNVLRRRYPLCELLLAPAQVQGTDAPQTIVRALEALQEDGRADVIVVARGGGSMEDLWCFNDERVARAVFASRIPVVSAIGHETDVTICDLVADLRAATPSAAAEIIAPHIRELEAEVAGLFERAELATRDILRRYRDETASRAVRLERRSPANAMRQERLRLDAQFERLRQRLTGRITTERTRTGAFERQLELLHPLHIMERGYAMVIDPTTGVRVHGVDELQPEQPISVQFKDGDATATVRSVNAAPRGARHVHSAR